MSPPIPFSLVAGGPFFRLLRAIGLAPLDTRTTVRLSLLAVAITWLPTMLLGWFLSDGRVELLHAYGFHTRLLVALPCLLATEPAMHVRTRHCIQRFMEGEWAKGQEDAIDRILDRTARLRDAVLPEALLLLAALALSESMLWGLIDPPAGHKVDWAGGRPPALVWYGVVALPIYQFLTMRWLWRWGLWAALLFRLSRLRIQPVVVHPDERGGLSLFSSPSVGLAWFVLGSSSVLAGSAATRIIHHDSSLQTFVPHALLVAFFSVALAFGPLLVFVGCLWCARFEGRRRYGQFANDYTRRFEARWIRGGDSNRPELLGTSDIQSLADLANSFHVQKSMRILPVSREAVYWVIAAAIAPWTLLPLTEVPLMELLDELASVLSGRLHG